MGLFDRWYKPKPGQGNYVLRSADGRLKAVMTYDTALVALTSGRGVWSTVELVDDTVQNRFTMTGDGSIRTTSGSLALCLLPGDYFAASTVEEIL